LCDCNSFYITNDTFRYHYCYRHTVAVILFQVLQLRHRLLLRLHNATYLRSLCDCEWNEFFRLEHITLYAARSVNMFLCSACLYSVAMFTRCTHATAAIASLTTSTRVHSRLAVKNVLRVEASMQTDQHCKQHVRRTANAHKMCIWMHYCLSQIAMYRPTSGSYCSERSARLPTASMYSVRFRL
jgi:hypothetical protein